ncbi:cation exporting V-type ATPase, subunit I [Paracholeplasma brassicae]|uniref:Cation exporting V-type ATPase, subunit I n=1 Tax=Acholeplasma brassicae TaxID=61635 RepID=U4KMW7_9MOLU|nr:V-type ATPase 116kDa subunit family protein [Paracholeplasma brassicae]CCV65597.1 cation exporting V-type ATPase, subunit I [Paracholeplasma brassicae]
MSIAKVKLVDMTSNVSNLDRVLTKFIDTKNFHPVLATEFVERVRGLTSFVSENPCQTMLQDLKDIEVKYDLNLPNDEIKDAEYNLNEMFEYMQTVKRSLEGEKNRIKDLEQHIREYENTLIQVKNLISLDVALDDLFACEYIFIRLGRLPNDSVEKLKFFQSRPFVFKSFSYDQNYSWCMYFTTEEYKREVDNIFSSLFFERIFIPDFVKGTPKEAIEALESEIDSARKQITSYKDDICSITDGCQNRLAYIKGELLFLNRLFESKKYVVGLGDKFTITGFIEEQHIEAFKQAFDGIEDLEIEVQEADGDKRITPPTKLKNGWFSKPFGMFVEMYGLPSYGELDPTPFVAITYSLLFGMMFGDLGQGLVLMLLGFLAYKYKGMRLGAIGIRIGLSSAIFGLLYGSVFGDEELLTPLYTDVLGLSHKPIHIMDADFTMTLLISAIAIGAVLIVISMILNLVTLYKKKDFVEFFCSHNGLAGLLFYGFVLVAVALQFGLGIPVLNPITISLFVGLPFLVIFLKEPIERRVHHHKMFPNGFGGFFVEAFFELFEIALSYVTNTMSFLRVGGFILSHAGMMLVVTSLMSMVGDAGWIVMIFGNLFVMALEGMIVGIQVLRLQFYEMFSRYYKGDGIAFNALNN